MCLLDGSVRQTQHNPVRDNSTPLEWSKTACFKQHLRPWLIHKASQHSRGRLTRSERQRTLGQADAKVLQEGVVTGAQTGGRDLPVFGTEVDRVWPSTISSRLKSDFHSRRLPGHKTSHRSV